MGLIDKLRAILGWKNAKEQSKASDEKTKEGKKEESESPEEQEKKKKEAEKKEFEAKRKALEDEVLNITGDDDQIIDRIQSTIIRWENTYEYFYGENDGKIAARNFSIIHVATSLATIITDRINSTLKGRINALKEHKTASEKRQMVLTETAVQMHKHNDDIMHVRNNDYKQFSMTLVWLYLIFGFTMIISDIAVSVNLVAFFGIGGEHPPEEVFWKKYIDMDLLLFSLGIAFCTVYVKVLYDEYLDGKLGYKQVLYERLKKDIDIKPLAWENVGKLLGKLLILSGLLFLLYNLAEYRTYFTIYEGGLRGDVLKMHADNINIIPILLNCFVGVTVMVPIISGVCLSLGLKIIGNRKLIIEAKKNKDAAAEELDNHIAESTKIADQLARLEGFSQEWGDSEKKIRIFAQSLSSKYAQGFKRAYMETFGNDIYVATEVYRNEMMHNVFTKKIINENQELYEN